MMINPRHEGILICREGRPVADKTSEVRDYMVDGDFVHITFETAAGPRTYKYSARNVLVLQKPVSKSMDEDTVISVRGQAQQGLTGVLCFQGRGGRWWRLFYASGSGENYRTYRDEEVSFLQNSDAADMRYRILHYWHDVVSKLAQKDPLRSLYESFHTIPRESVLDLYLRGEVLNSQAADERGEVIVPFSSNLSQRAALQAGLAHRISVIDGPPGTGKTQTILNLVANIIRTPGQTVAVVSSTNAAVENVRDKLAAEGYGHVVADLRRAELRSEFFSTQQANHFLAQRRAGATPVPVPAAGRIAEMDERLLRLQELDRELLMQRQELDAYKLEQRHFSRHLAEQDPVQLPPLALLKRDSTRILEFLAETASIPAEESAWRKMHRRLRGLIRYGSTRNVDPTDTDVVMRLQAAFYDKRISELEEQIEHGRRRLDKADFAALENELKEASRQALDASLHLRYAAFRPQVYSENNYLGRFQTFITGYPVILSTCHSLRRHIPPGHLLDYLIIDEASQVDLLAAGLALSCARNVIVVGDLRQLQHIPVEDAAQRAEPAPSPSYDYVRHNILSSIIERFGDAIPRTMLREHYRCDPAIIDFCNRKFYGGRLIPYTTSAPGYAPLIVVRTAPGNHMRQHQGGGRTNQREADVIAKEVLERFCAGTRHEDIGVVTPYRRQVDKVAETLLNSIQADTVHRFQGREKEIIIMSTVLDETRSGNSGMEFVDNAQLVNVAVSRAVKRFVLVTNHRMLPASRHLRDLVHFMQYRDPGTVVFDSEVLSVFDLLYKEYSALLRPLAARLQRTSEFASENIMSTLLLDIIAEEPFRDLAVAQQVVLRNLLPTLSRLTPEQAAYVRNRASTDFLIYNRTTNRPVLALEVDGFAFHEADEAQQARDILKDAVCRAYNIPLLRLPTTGSGEAELIRRKLFSVM